MTKVAYILPTLVAMGGTERIITQKANYLAEQFGYDVSIICCNQQDGRPNFYHVSSKVRQINLGIPYYKQYIYKYPKRLWFKIWVDRQLKKKLTRTIKILNPDFVISIGRFKDDMICKIPSNAIKIIECHDAKYFMFSNMEKRSILSRFCMRFYLKSYYRTIERQADLVVVLTDGAKDLWEKAKRVEIIPNFTSISISRMSDCTSKRVIAIGRLCHEKGFERLIEIGKSVSEKCPDWHLDIFGQGELEDLFTQQINRDKIKNITLRGITHNVSQEYATSSILAVTSHHEAFSLVILEAMKHGVPCIAFDCPYGPRTIIENNRCGFLVENGNNELYEERLCQLIEDSELRQLFSAASIERTNCFNIDTIMSKWKTLFEELIQQKKT